jgi:CHAT domain-containing protein
LRTARIESLLLSSSLQNGYGESLVRLRKLEALLATSELTQLRQRIAALENGAGLSPEHTSPQSSERALADQISIQKSLGARHALISFMPGEPKSVVWAVTGASFEWHFVPGRTELERLAREWVRELRGQSASADGAGRELSALLFGKLSAQVRERERWVLSLDDFLFEVPLAALPDPFSRGLLLQAHCLNLIPSAYLLGERAPSRTSPLLVAVGDPVYNQADPRWSMVAAAGRGPWRMLPVLQAQAASPPAGIELPRLVGSEREVRAVEQVWSGSGRPVRRRVGLDAPESPRTFGGEPPEVLHFAVHVLPLGDAAPAPAAGYGFLRQPGDVGMAMGLGPDGEHRFLSPATIAGLPVRGSLVVLNGCSSGRADALPGAGLFGLTRAWLAAGAGSVVATLWPAADDSGAFFEVFYRDYLRGLDSGRSSPATALRSAQLAALRSGTWRAHPRYWAAYFAMGKE